MDMHYIDSANDKLLVKLQGEMDAAGCAKLRPCLEHLMSEQRTNPGMLLDLSELNFLDSTGISVIVLMFKRLKAQGKSLEIIEAQGQPRQLLELLRVGNAIPLHPSRIDAKLDEEPRQCVG